MIPMRLHPAAACRKSITITYFYFISSDKGGIKLQQRINRKRFVRYKEGAEMYSMCQSKFERMAKEAKAFYKLDKLVLVNCDIFEAYLEGFHLSE